MRLIKRITIQLFILLLIGLNGKISVAQNPGDINFIHVLGNLIKKAKEAMTKNPPKPKVLTIKTWQDEYNVYLAPLSFPRSPGLRITYHRKKISVPPKRL